MLVILRENVENLGRTGEIVKVSDGYARNFLLPRNLVAIADAHNKAAVEKHKQNLEKKRLAERATSQELANKLQDFSITLTRKVGDQDKLFGSVSVSDIVDALKAAGYTVEKRAIVLENPIKTLGVHSVTVKMEADIKATLKVWVVKE